MYLLCIVNTISTNFESEQGFLGRLNAFTWYFDRPAWVTFSLSPLFSPVFMIALYGWTELWWIRLSGTSPLVYDVCNLLALLHNTCSSCEASESKIVMFGGLCSSFEARQTEKQKVLEHIGTHFFTVGNPGPFIYLLYLEVSTAQHLVLI